MSENREPRPFQRKTSCKHPFPQFGSNTSRGRSADNMMRQNYMSPYYSETPVHTPETPPQLSLNISNALFDPNLSSPPNEFIQKLKLRMDVYFEPAVSLSDRDLYKFATFVTK